MSNQAKRILCVGAAVLDTIFRVNDLPKGEGKILPYEMLEIAEGMAASAAYAIVRLRGQASLWGAVGDDETGGRILRDLGADGIDMSGMTVAPGARSALSTILVDDRGERLIVPFYDHRLHDAAKTFDDAEIAGFDAVLVDVRWPKLALNVLQAARRVGIPAILDGDVAPVEVLERLAPAASHIVFSEPAGASLTGTSDIPDMLMTLLQKLPDTLLCVTAGSKGCYWLDETTGAVQHQETLTITAVDTLAAGDAFHGAFALGVAEGLPLRDTMQLASVTAALKCEVFGGRRGMPTRAQAESALQRL